MNRLKFDKLTLANDTLLWNGMPFTGTVFNVNSALCVHASVIAAGRFVSAYRPDYFRLVTSDLHIDMSIQLNDDDGPGVAKCEHAGVPLTGIGYAFDEDGFCYREVGFVGGEEVFDAQFASAGMIGLDFHNSVYDVKQVWHPNGRLNLMSIQANGNQAISVALGKDGRLLSLLVRGSPFDDFGALVPEFSSFPLQKKEQISSLRYGEKLFLTGDFVDSSLLHGMAQQLKLSGTQQIYFNSTEIDGSALSVLLALPALVRLHFESANEAQLELAREFKKLRPTVAVSFYRIVPGSAKHVENL